MSALDELPQITIITDKIGVAKELFINGLSIKKFNGLHVEFGTTGERLAEVSVGFPAIVTVTQPSEVKLEGDR